MEKIQKQVFKATEGDGIPKNRETNSIHEILALLEPREHCFTAL